MVIVDFSATILRGVSVLISFVVSMVIPSSLTEWRLAEIPMIVAIQVANAVATRSVGEKDSPLPSLSTGASVEREAPEGPWVAEQRSCPSYETEIFTKLLLSLVVSRTRAASPTPRETEEEHNSRARHCTEKNLEELEGH